MRVGDDATLAARHAASQRAFYATVTPCTPGGRIVSLEGGVQAAITPATPSRSLFNAVVYEDGDALLRVRDELEEAYAESGIEAWTVWARPGDERVAEALRSAGHSLDARPLLMAARLDRLDLAGRDGWPRRAGTTRRSPSSRRPPSRRSRGSPTSPSG